MECSEKYIPQEEWMGGDEFDKSQAKQRECLAQPSVVDWEALQPALDRAAASIGKVLNPHPFSYRLKITWPSLSEQIGEEEMPEPGTCLPACIEVFEYVTEVARAKPLCRKHPKYHAIYAPRAECSICWDAWDAKHGLEGYNHG